MSEKTNIQWCDSTLNFWIGCTKVSPGCAHCYAEKNIGVKMRGQKWGAGQPRVKSVSAVKQALALNRKPWVCNSCGGSFFEIKYHECNGAPSTNCSPNNWHRRRIFSLSLGDWLDDEVPIAWFLEMMHTIWQCDKVTWMLCSKRWENFQKRFLAALDVITDGTGSNADFWQWLVNWSAGKAPQNIIGLCSVENQEAADKRIPQFLTVPLACRGLSMEPLLGLVDFRQIKPLMERFNSSPYGWHNWLKRYLHWVIIGGESGPNARPCNVDWIRSIVQQGNVAGVATFVKQLGSYPTATNDDEKYPVGFFAHKKGGDPSEWPADLRVQEWPKGF